ncbi:MAG: sulfur carrier protein ThiS [Desulfuromusa sp.]|nr:sulfur carrier protein ThiS [Desulfuromusa sp.]
MELIINAERHEYQEPLTVLELLQRLNLNPERVIVEINRTILSPAEHHETELKQGDTIELVQFVGGG